MTPVLKSMPPEADILGLVSIADLRRSLRISYTNEDDYIKDCILAAYAYYSGPKGWLNRSMLPTVWTLSAGAFSGAPLGFPTASARALTSISYLKAGVTTVVSNSLYQFVIGNDGYGMLQLRPDMVWPIDADIRPDAITYEYTSGIGASPADLKAKAPDLIRAITIKAADFFRNREDTFVDVRVVEIDRKIINNADHLAGRYKIFNRIV